jgi:predicted ATPase
MENKITAFYVENFKAIEKGTWFEINNLTIITGANNSGKSTLFKAMNVISNGFTKSDFPLIDIQKTLPGNGYFNDLVTHESQKNFFKVGYRYYSARFDNNIEVLYQFVEGEKKQFAVFGSMTVTVNKKEILAIYSPSSNSEPISILDNYGRKSVFKSVLEDSNPGEIVFKVNMVHLQSIYSQTEIQGHSAFFDKVASEFHNLWYGEAFIEELFYDTKRFHYTRIAGHLYADLLEDYFCNFYNYDHKYSIFHDTDGDEVLVTYSKDIKNFGYKEFLISFIKPIFDEISHSLNFFYNQQLFHLKMTDSFYERVILANEISFKIPIIDTSKFKPQSEKNTNAPGFLTAGESMPLIIKSMLFFLGFTGNIKTKEVDNYAYQVFYVTSEGVNYNIADLGKGQAQIIQLLLAIGSRIIEEEELGNHPENKKQFIKQSIFHLEEPEVYLHPKWQSKLADIFTIIGKTNMNLLVETHSEYLIRKLQYIVAKGKFKPEKITIYYFEDPDKRKKSSKLQLYRTIKLDKNGQMNQDFGHGFFDEADNIAIQLFNLNQQGTN